MGQSSLVQSSDRHTAASKTWYDVRLLQAISRTHDSTEICSWPLLGQQIEITLMAKKPAFIIAFYWSDLGFVPDRRNLPAFSFGPSSVETPFIVVSFLRLLPIFQQSASIRCGAAVVIFREEQEMKPKKKKTKTAKGPCDKCW